SPFSRALVRPFLILKSPRQMQARPPEGARDADPVSRSSHRLSADTVSIGLGPERDPVDQTLVPVDWRIEAMGDRCLMVEFGERVDEEINRAARSVAEYLLENPVEGVVDIVPAFTSVAIYYEPRALVDSSDSEAPHRRLKHRLEEILRCGVARRS